MAFNVQDFRASLTYDGARASLFDVVITPPTGLPGLAGVNGVITSQIAFKARASSLPGDAVSSINVNYFGREIKVAGTRTFPDWSITVINDEDFVIRRFFESWMSGLNSHVANLRTQSLARMADYQADAWVRQYAKTGEVIKVYKIVGMFPTDVAAIDVDWASGDTIEEYAITLAYQWWESETTDSAGTSPSGIPPTAAG